MSLSDFQIKLLRGFLKTSSSVALKVTGLEGIVEALIGSTVSEAIDFAIDPEYLGSTVTRVIANLERKLGDELAQHLSSFDLDKDSFKAVVQNAKEALTELSQSPELWYKHNLDPETLAKDIIKQHAPYEESSEHFAVWRILISSSTAQVMEVLQNTGELAQKITPELVKQQQLTQQQVDTINEGLKTLDEKLNNLDVDAIVRKVIDGLTKIIPDNFEEQYLQALLAAPELKAQIIGLPNIQDYCKDYSVQVAFLSATVTGSKQAHSRDFIAHIRSNQLYGLAIPEELKQTTQQKPIHLLLAETKRLLLRGEAGSGKTTIVQWLTGLMCSGNFSEYPELKDQWEGKIPFLIQLRQLEKRKVDLNNPDDFVYLSGIKPADNWVHTILHSGKGVIMLDGIDEVPPEERDTIKQHIESLCKKYPEALFVVTSRLEAIKDTWLQELDFNDAVLLDLQINEIKQFIDKWHKALSFLYDQGYKHVSSLTMQNLQQKQKGLLEQIDQKPSLQQVARTPLLCASLCALNLDAGDQQLPENRLELYELLTEMLLRKRDEGRAIPSRLPQDLKRQFIGKLALFMLRMPNENNTPRFIASKEDILGKFKHNNSLIELKEEEILQELLERSGLIRYTSHEQVEFNHRTLAEYFAGRELFSEGELAGVMRFNMANDQWQEVIRFGLWYAKKTKQKDYEDLLKITFKHVEKGDRDQKRIKKFFIFSLFEGNINTYMPLHEKCEQYLPEILPLQDKKETLLVSYWSKHAIRHLVYQQEWVHEQAGYAIDALRFLENKNTIDSIKNTLQTYYIYVPINHPGIPEPVVNSILKFRNPELKSLEGLPQLSGLTNLTLDNLPELKSLEGLPQLSGLKALTLMNLPELKSLEGLSQLSGLTDLRLYNLPELKSLEVLSQLSGLKALMLMNLPELKSLEVLSQLSGLTNLRLDNLPELKSLELLSQLSGLTNLRLYNLPELKSLEGLSQLSGLTDLELNNLPELKSLEVLSQLSGLTNLRLYNLPELKSLEVLSQLSGLTDLTLDSLPELRSLEGLPQLSGLTTLGLENLPKIKSLEGVPQFLNLQDLLLFDLPELESIEALSRLTKITHLKLLNLPKIKSLEVLFQLPNLTNLWLEKFSNLKNTYSDNKTDVQAFLKTLPRS